MSTSTETKCNHTYHEYGSTCPILASETVVPDTVLESLATQLESQASTLARVVGERDRLREALRNLLQIVEDEGHADNYIPQVQAARTALTTTTGQEEG